MLLLLLLELLLPTHLPHSDGRYPQRMSRNEPTPPLVASVRHAFSMKKVTDTGVYKPTMLSVGLSDRFVGRAKRVRICRLEKLRLL